MQEKSKCRVAGWLHRYRIKKSYPEGVLEVCDICKDRKFFKNEAANYVYLSFHMRQALSKDHPRFYKEYPKKEAYL